MQSLSDGTEQGLIKRMIALDPSDRPTFDAILHSSRNSIFPESFYTPLYDFVSSVNNISVASPFITAFGNGTLTPTPSTVANLGAVSDEKAGYSATSAVDTNVLPGDSDRRLWRVWAEYDSLEPVISSTGKDPENAIKVDYTTSYSSSKPLQVRVLPIASAIVCIST